MFSKTTSGTSFQIVFIVLLYLVGQTSLYAVGSQIPATDNLAETGQLSRQQGVPVIVFVSRDACPYCRTLRDKILQPMLSANKFEKRANLVEISLDRVDPLTGFENQQITAKAFGELYQAVITPTLLFLDAEGREISKRIIGISNLELYGFYLQESIDEALLVIRTGVPGG
jgi:thioredoxin-related protein